MDPGGFQRTPTAVRRIEAELRSDILAGNLAPGTVLHQEALASRYHTGRTPVRQALVALEGEGLVSLPTGRTAIVSEVSAKMLVELVEMRLLLEPFMAGRAATNMPTSVIVELQERVQEARGAANGPDVVNTVDQLVHATFSAWCGNARMARTVNDLHAMLALARVQDLASRHADVLSSLESILRAAAARDADATEVEMREHIRPFTTYFASPSHGPMDR